jgi:hypothetical protein
VKEMAIDYHILADRPLFPGLAAVVFYAAHLWQWARLKRLENILWACHIGCLLIGLGWLTGWPLANGIGLVWLLPGIFFWAIYLAGGGAFFWSSLLIHVGGNLLGLMGAISLGFPAGTWWKAGLAYVVLILISRRFSRVAENVNFSRQVWSGWETRFPSYRRYLTGLVLGAFGLFFALEQVLRQILSAQN